VLDKEKAPSLGWLGAFLVFQAGAWNGVSGGPGSLELWRQCRMAIGFALLGAFKLLQKLLRQGQAAESGYRIGWNVGPPVEGLGNGLALRHVALGHLGYMEAIDAGGAWERHAETAQVQSEGLVEI
jgi:hypothetical protein